jgi:hypothetical protein
MAGPGRACGFSLLAVISFPLFFFPFRSVLSSYHGAWLAFAFVLALLGCFVFITCNGGITKGKLGILHLFSVSYDCCRLFYQAYSHPVLSYFIRVAKIFFSFRLVLHSLPSLMQRRRSQAG